MTMFDRIKLLAKKRDSNLKTIAVELGYGENYFYSIKSGKSPSSEKLQEIADYFGVSTDYLLGRTDNPNTNSEASKEVDISDDTVIMTYGGQPLSDADKQVILAATKALVEQRKLDNK